MGLYGFGGQRATWFGTISSSALRAITCASAIIQALRGRHVFSGRATQGNRLAVKARPKLTLAALKLLVASPVPAS